MRSSACAALAGGLARTAGAGASLDFFLVSLCSVDAAGSAGTLIKFQRMPPPLSITSMAVKTCVPSG